MPYISPNEDEDDKLPIVLVVLFVLWLFIVAFDMFSK